MAPVVTGVSGKWTAGLAIDGQPILVSPDVVKKIVVRSSVHRKLPSVAIDILDYDYDLTKRVGVRDGQRIDVHLGDGTGKGYNGVFRIVGDPHTKDMQQGVYISIHGMLDALPWVRQVSTKHFKGTSAGLMALLGTQAGLAVEADPTSDFMTWLPNRKPLVRYAHHMALRGYAGATSCMVLGVTETGVLRYKNVERIMRSAHGGPILGVGGLPILEWTAASKGATYNQSAAYGSTLMKHTLDGVISMLSSVDVAQFSGSFGFSNIMAAAAGALGTRVENTPIDSGNTHKMYYDAKNQNRRIKATYSNDIHILLRDFTGYTILDGAPFRPLDKLTGGVLDRYAGDFIVTSKVMAYQGDAYSEILTLTNQG